jgi:hypothetical protein
MGTTLTGTTPQDTYDSLIKVTDNGPIGATAKLLTDGLGNDSVLYLGTAGLGIKSTSVLSFNVNDATHSVGYDSVIDGSQLRGQNGIRFSTGSVGGTERMRIKSGGSMDFSATDAVAVYNFGYNRPTASNLLVNGTNNNKIKIQNSESDIVVLNSNGDSYFNGGNVGIGTTPSAWGSGFLGLDLGGSTAANIGGISRTRFASNIYYDGSDFVLKQAFGGAYYFQDAVGINHTWGTAATGTAGGTATLVERMRIDSSGNVGIGTSSPNIGGYVAGNTILTMAPSGSDKFSVLQLSGNRGFGGNQNGNIDFLNSEGTATITSRISAQNGASALDGQIAFETRTSAGSLTERVRITAAGVLELAQGQIKFPATQVPSADANTLDDYEEGTWTPVLSDGTNNATMDVNTIASYTKIGRVVYCSFTVSTSSLGSVSGNIQVNGLPFAQGVTFGPSAFTSSANQLLNITSGQFVSGRILGNNTFIQLWLNDDSAGMTQMQATEWSSNGYANFTGYYFV